MPYMAPECLQGQEADARSDLFSFGCVLYEMVTGRRAFEGKSQLSVLTAILEKDPEPVSKVQPATPTALEHVIHVDTPDTAPTEDEPSAPRAKPPNAPPPAKTAAANTSPPG